MQNLQELPRFDNVKDMSLRAANRGAILANIYEDYLECYLYEDHTDYYPLRSIKNLKEYFGSYLEGLTESEKSFAIREMVHHLTKRGINFESKNWNT